jgi:hypothetical protein
LLFVPFFGTLDPCAEPVKDFQLSSHDRNTVKTIENLRRSIYEFKDTNCTRFVKEFRPNLISKRCPHDRIQSFFNTLTPSLEDGEEKPFSSSTPEYLFIYVSPGADQRPKNRLSGIISSDFIIPLDLANSNIG